MPFNCGDRRCDCGIVSSTLTVARSGDTFTINSSAFGNYTSGTRPSSPTQWQHIFETDTQRYRVWNGTHWVIVGGPYPEFLIERQATLSAFANNAEGTVTLPIEVLDSDAFHASTDGLITIPAGLGGDYVIFGRVRFAANATGHRYARLLVASNTNAPTQNNTAIVGGQAMANTADNGFVVPEIFRLEAGATVTLRAFQNSGGTLDILGASLKGYMIRHIPSLT